MILHLKLDFEEHIQNVLNKVSKTVRLLRKLQNILPRPPLITIYKLFYKVSSRLWRYYLRSSIQPFLSSETSIQYNGTLAITGAIRGTSKEKLYHELDLQAEDAIINAFVSRTFSRVSHPGIYSTFYST